ncbi:MAG TPA: ABC transporter ATP-binding protein [Actinomycetota bacterium]|nr:ABC transporter ATP-binding protein [Actinomycetota bacterium]
MDRLDLEVPAGTLFGFLGPNGAGKTTTIRMLLGLIFPTDGDVEVLGEAVFGAGGSRVVRRVGAMIEEPAAWPYLSGRRNLQYHARAGGPRDDRSARLGRVDDVLQIVGLEDAAGKKVAAYSQGMRQRLGIAQALLGSPEVLVLDEPTNGLDPGGMREIRALLRRLADDGVTVFVSSHLLFEVEAMCDRVGVLARGRLVAEGPPADLRAPADRFRIEVDDRSAAVTVLSSLVGVEIERAAGGSESPGSPAGALAIRLRPPAAAAAVNAALVAAGVGVSALVPVQGTLEDVFLELVGEAGSAGPAGGDEVGDVRG